MAVSTTDGVYVNTAIEEYVNEALDTKLRAKNFVTIDNTLQGEDGESVKIYRYSDSGAAEEVSEGAGNSGYSDITGTSYTYTIKTVQDRAKLTDEEIKRNPFACEAKLDFLADHLVNKENADIFVQWASSTNLNSSITDTTNYIPTFDEFIDSVGKLDVGLDAGYNGIEEQVYCFMNPLAWNTFRKGLNSNVLVEYDQINGKLRPRINGVPIEISDICGTTIGAGASAKTVPNCFFATNKAVRLVTAPSVTSEQTRDANTRTTEYYVRYRAVAALEFNNKVVLLKAAPTP